jgi:hypothetical protein
LLLQTSCGSLFLNFSFQIYGKKTRAQALFPAKGFTQVLFNYEINRTAAYGRLLTGIC